MEGGGGGGGETRYSGGEAIAKDVLQKSHSRGQVIESINVFAVILQLDFRVAVGQGSQLHDFESKVYYRILSLYIENSTSHDRNV